MLYIAFLARTLKPTSISNYTNIIRIIHLEAGFDNPLDNNFAVKNLKRGIDREKGCTPKQMLPFTVEMLTMIREHLSFLNAADVAFWAAVCIAFYGFLRKATLLPKSKTLAGNECLLKGDLKLINYNLARLYVRRTKTIQNNERVLILPFVACPQSSLCPVKAVRNLQYLSPNDPSLPLFCYREKGVIHWWNHQAFTERLRVLLKKSGFPSNEFSCHSFRRGGASLAFKLGLSRTEIQKRGDWRSHAVDEYVILDDAQDIQIASILATGVSKLTRK